MVKIKGPLFSVGAHGSLDKVLTYSKRRSGDQTRKYNKPAVPASPAQRGQRRLTEFLVAHWQNMTPAQKATWETNAKASDKKLSGYHYFLREAQRDLYTHHGLCIYLPCNEIVGGKVLDLSGKANHGTLKPDYPTNAPLLTPSKSPRFSNALKFDGLNDYVLLPRVIQDDFTIMFWFNSTQMFGTSDHWYHGAGLIDGEMPGKQNDFGVSFGQGIVMFGVGNPDITIKSSFLADGKWHSVAATRIKSTGVTTLFIDSFQVATGTGGTQSLSTPQNLRIGSLQTNINFFKGVIDEVCLYNRSFSTAEIATRFDFATRKV